MFFSTKKFNKEISSLKSLHQDSLLHPLRQEQIKQSILAQIKSGAVPSLVATGSKNRRARFLQVIASALASLGLVAGTAFASNTAIPGDLLYPVKRAVEKVQVSLTVSTESKAKLQSEIAKKRLDELSAITVKIDEKLDVDANVGIQNPKTTDRKVKELRAKVETDTNVQVQGALDALNKVKVKLEAEHKTRAAEVISQNIENLTKRQAEVKVNLENIRKHLKSNLDKTINDTNSTNTNSETHSEINIKNNDGKPIKVELSNPGSTTHIEASATAGGEQGSVEVRINNTETHTSRSLIEIH